MSNGTRRVEGYARTVTPLILRVTAQMGALFTRQRLSEGRQDLLTV